MPHRLLFASIHSYLDPSSGAALATRELLELLAARGWDCRALTCGVLDFQNETPLDDVLAAMGRPSSRTGAALSRGGRAEVFDLELDKVHVTLLPTAFRRGERAPSAREAGLFLDLADQVLAQFRPEVPLTYGGHSLDEKVIIESIQGSIGVTANLSVKSGLDSISNKYRRRDSPAESSRSCERVQSGGKTSIRLAG